MILLKITYCEENLNATSIDDFYYRNWKHLLKDSQGTGVRKLVKEMIDQKKILYRSLILSNDGNKLEITTVFADRISYEEFDNHPIVNYSKSFWQNRAWKKSRELTEITDLMFLQ
jgi:hypothetical protein